MDMPLKAPRNRTAELQLILRHVAKGYVFWTADEIPLCKLTGFLKKWEHLRILADPPARSWRKRIGRANTHLVLEHLFNGREGVPLSPEMKVRWLLLGAAGRDGLDDSSVPQPGAVLDARTAAGRVLWMGYELVYQRKTFKTADGRLKSDSTWTWRIPVQRYKEWEAHVVCAAKQLDYSALAKTFAILGAFPMFAGIRKQVFQLFSETNKMLRKVGGIPMKKLELPYVTLTRIW